MSEPNYYAVIPAEVRYSEKLSPSAKLMYGEISSLCNAKGFCWASNAYFAKSYGATKRSVINWINELEAEKFIMVEGRTATDGEVQRQITLGVVKKITRGTDKNFTHNNKSNKELLSKDNNSLVSLTREKEVLELLSSITGRSFRVLPKGAPKTLKLFTKDEIEKALINLAQDDWHKPKLKTLSSGYLLRPEVIDKWLSAKKGKEYA